MPSLPEPANRCPVRVGGRHHLGTTPRYGHDMRNKIVIALIPILAAFIAKQLQDYLRNKEAAKTAA